jgi:uncharacterized protein involved in exopolysaccharide biosynthesis
MREYEREVELYDYIEVLLKYKLFILIATVVCGSIGWVLRPDPTPPLYEADAVLMVKNLPSSQNSQQVEIPTGTQSSGFYNALALADDLKQALIDSLDLEMSVVAMDGMLNVQVLDPGVRLTVRSHSSELPIRLVNKWAKLFVERNGDLNVEEVGTYYEWVQSQYYTERARLDSIETQLHQFEAKNSIEFLQLQSSMLDSTSINLYNKIANNRLRQQEAKLDSLLAQQNFALAESALKAIKKRTVGKTSISMSTIQTALALIDREDLASAESALKAIKKSERLGKISIKTIQTALALIDRELAIELDRYDKENNIDLVYEQKKLLEEYSQRIGIDVQGALIAHMKEEIKSHPKKIAGEPNSTRLQLASILSTMEVDLTNMLLASSPEKDEISTTMDLEQVDVILRKRGEIISWYQEMKVEVKNELLNDSKERITQLKDMQNQAESRYSHYATVRDSITNRLRIVELQQQSRQDLLKVVKKELGAVKDTLSFKMNEQQRLIRDQGVYNETVARFSKLLEEARIAREKAAGDIRILTRALEVRQIPQEQGRHKAAVATGVGFLLSCILSLLAEYIRKARHNRLEAQQKSA